MTNINFVLLQWFIYILIYNYAGAVVSGAAIKSEFMSSEQLAEGLQIPFTRKFAKRKLYSSFKDNI